ncbi:hypothetical protein BUL40_09360 [Croceivirga radicis]|uniref:Peptidase C39 domain-containing protein n=1 Tax=Croceivirga radicis TaxID=1929488 RepID=A0A1V6LRE2_9FLAO|nr:vitamin K epoxide reductase family protein [Croceivirga radicis]OQD42718.1 hypothetical protein BUL40_09360 [Croceivirga radicis]
MDNCTFAAGNLLAQLKIKHTNQFLGDTILSHPEHPSLLAVSETLSKYNIENLAVKIDKEKLKELPLPCIVQLTDSGGMFHALVRYSKEETVYLDDKGKQVSIPTNDFLKRWSGICLLVETSELSGEPGIEKKLSERRTMTALKWIGALFLLLWAILNFFNSPLIHGTDLLLLGGYALLKLVGLTMGGMLLWYEVDKYNPTLQSFCSGGKKVNCDSVLNSKYAKVFNGKLSLGLIGFTYFFGTFFFLLINGFSNISLTPLAYMGFAALPVVALSAYYQGVVIKQWCKFCIVVQAVLLLEATTAFLGGFHLARVEVSSLPLLIALLFIPIPIWKWLKPLMEKEKETNLYKRGLKKIKNNPDVLMGLLGKNRKIETPVEGLGITLKNDGARYDVIKVCNPYCGPCAKAHPVLEGLVEDNKINLQILFTATADKKDFKAKPVRHFLAIASKEDKKETQKALDDWYLSESKDYGVFAQRYPMNGELEQQDEKIKAMRQWCNAEKITHTPTIFINGHELPKEYSVEDLKNVLI